MTTPITLLLTVDRVGGKIGSAGDKLRIMLPADFPSELKHAIRRHKPALLELLKLNFLMVRSDVLNTTVFWTADETTKESLADSGAEFGSIYTTAELGLLVRRGTTFAELGVIHAAKQRFDGRIA